MVRTQEGFTPEQIAIEEFVSFVVLCAIVGLILSVFLIIKLYTNFW